MPLEFSIEIKNLDKFAAKMQQSPQLTRQYAQNAINQAGQSIRDNIREITPMKTGDLRKSVRVSYGILEATISTNSPYAIFVHEGTRPHTIRPLNKKALFWKGARHPVKQVFHPGTKANPFFEKGLEDSSNDIDAIFKRQMDNLMEQLTVK